MKFVFTSDLHGHLPEIPPCDVLVLAGDLCPDHPIGKSERYGLADNGASYQAEWLDGPFRYWARRMLNDRAGRIVAIWGNHDFVGEKRALWEPLQLPVRFLQDEEISIEGVRLYGTPWVPGLPRWAFYASDGALKARAHAIPEGLDILVTHGPPLGTADFVAPRFGSKSVGDRSLGHELERIQPGLLVCGHIHEQYGQHNHLGTPVWNVSYVDENYVPGNGPMELYL